MRVLVTGGTGFVGAWTAKAAQEQGHQVRFLVRNPERLRTSAGQIGVDTSDHVVGDIADAASTEAAMANCDAVIHCAAMVSTDPNRADEMLTTNFWQPESTRSSTSRASRHCFGRGWNSSTPIYRSPGDRMDTDDQRHWWRPTRGACRMPERR
ncbi:MAG: oxidoreductase [Mycobacterium sp.]|nr:oxidoreductase [Mycobacterium sp.]